MVDDDDDASERYRDDVYHGDRNRKDCEIAREDFDVVLFVIISEGEIAREAFSSKRMRRRTGSSLFRLIGDFPRQDLRQLYYRRSIWINAVYRPDNASK